MRTCHVSRAPGHESDVDDRFKAAATGHPRRGDHRGRDADGAFDAHRRRAPRADRGRAQSGLRGVARGRSGGLRVRLGSHAARRRGVRARPRRRPSNRRGGLRRDHRRRPGDDGGGQPRRSRGGRGLGRAQHRAAVRAGDEPLRRHRPQLRLLLQSQADVRALLAAPSSSFREASARSTSCSRC